MPCPERLIFVTTATSVSERIPLLFLSNFFTKPLNVSSGKFVSLILTSDAVFSAETDAGINGMDKTSARADKPTKIFFFI